MRGAKCTYHFISINFILFIFSLENAEITIIKTAFFLTADNILCGWENKKSGNYFVLERIIQSALGSFSPLPYT
jgi:hypothetical protein